MPIARRRVLLCFFAWLRSWTPLLLLYLSVGAGQQLSALSLDGPTAVAATTTVILPVPMTVSGATGLTASVLNPVGTLNVTTSFSGNTLRINPVSGTGTAKIRVQATDGTTTVDHDMDLVVNPAITIVPNPTAVTTTVTKTRIVTLTIAGGTNRNLPTVVVQNKSNAQLMVNAAISGNTLSITPTSGSGTADVVVACSDSVSAIGSVTIRLTVNPAITLTLPGQVGDTILVTTNATLTLPFSVTGGTGDPTLTATLSSTANGRSVSISTITKTNVILTTGTAASDFTLTVTATDTEGVFVEVPYTISPKTPLVWSTAPTGMLTVVSLGGSAARSGKVACVTSGGHNNPTVSVAHIPPAAPFSSFLSATRTDTNTTLSVGMATSPTGIPSASQTYPSRVTINDSKTSITSDLTIRWFVHQALSASGLGSSKALVYALASPGYAAVLDEVTYNDPAGQAGDPDLLYTSTDAPLTITCTRVTSLTAPIYAWKVGEDQLLCRSTQGVTVIGNQLLLGGTTLVATWLFSPTEGKLTITASALSAGGGIALVNKMLACIAYTNPAGPYATGAGDQRRIAISVTACQARGTNLISEAFARNIIFTSQPPAFKEVKVEPGGRVPLELSFTPASTGMICQVNAPGPLVGSVRKVLAVSDPGTEVSSFTLLEVIQGQIYYQNRDGGASVDPFDVRVTDQGVELGSNIPVPVTISLGNGLTILGDPLLFVIPVNNGTTDWTAVARGPTGTSAGISVVPWFPETTGTVIGVAALVTSTPLVGQTEIKVRITWSALATVASDGTITYPSFLRFRLRVKIGNDDVVVEQPCLVRVLGPTVPRSVQLQAAN